MKVFRAQAVRTLIALSSVLLLPVVASSTVASALEKNTAYFPLGQEPPQLNGMKATDQVSFFVLGHVMEGLTRIGKDGIPVAGVAESWKLDDKGATFKIRKNAKWSDGKAVTAKDFVYAWRTALDPKTASEYAFILYYVKNAEAINQGKMPGTELGVQAVDDSTLKVTFEKPCGFFLGLTAFPTYLPVREDFHKQSGDKYGAEATTLLYNGPFVLTKWVHGASLRFDKNANYWNASAIKLAAIDVPYVTSDNNARFNFFKDNKVDLLETLNKDDLPKALQEHFKTKPFADGTLLFMEFNFRDGHPTRNLNLRKAIAEVVNYKEYVDRIVGIPGTQPGLGIVPRWLNGVKNKFRAEYPMKDRKMDLSAAKKYVEAAKKELGGTLPALTWLTGDSNLAGKEAEYFQQIFKSQLGIDLKIDKQIFKQRLAKMTSGDFDIVAAGWGPDYADPMTFVDLMASWNENNRGKYSNKQVDDLIRKAQGTANQKIRMDSMAAAEKIVLDELAVLPTYERTVMSVYHDRIQGVVRHQVGPDPDFTFATVKE